MITQEFRPKTFEEMAGQQLVKRVLKAIVKNPEKAPRSIILQGPFGSGKTTGVRILAKAINCQHSKDGNPCMKCSNCLEPLDSSPFYAEYDAAIVGNIDRIRELRDTFYYTIKGGWKVIVFDECHMASRAAQTALLKVIEESPPRVIFVFATTHVDQILPTIRSRSLELRYETVAETEIVTNLKGILSKLSNEVPDEILGLIASRSKGHMRNAHMLLDQYFMIGEEDFRESMKSARAVFIKYFEALAQKDKNKVFQSIDELLTFPLADLKVDFDNVVVDMTKQLVGYSQYKDIESIVKILGVDTLKIVKICMADWVKEGFTSDVALQTCLLCLYQLVSSSLQKPVNNTNNLMARAAKR